MPRRRSGKTEHVEAVHITFDKKVVSYAKLLDVFFDSIDPFQVPISMLLSADVQSR